MKYASVGVSTLERPFLPETRKRRHSRHRRLGCRPGGASDRAPTSVRDVGLALISGPDTTVDTPDEE
jgi:hypothetical protein